MLWLAILLLVIVVWLVARGSGKAASSPGLVGPTEAAPARRAEYFDQRIAVEMSDVLTLRVDDPDSSGSFTYWHEVDFKSMRWCRATLVEVDLYEDVYALFRSSRGRWFVRWLLHRESEGLPLKVLAPELAVEEANAGWRTERDPEFKLSYLRELAEATHWRRAERIIEVPCELAFQRCVRFFEQHPGVSPRTTRGEYIAARPEGGAVWLPPVHQSEEVVAASLAEGDALVAKYSAEEQACKLRSLRSRFLGTMVAKLGGSLARERE